MRDVNFEAPFITTWAARFRASDDPPARLVRGYERQSWALWKETTDLRALVGEMRSQLSEAEPAPREASMRESLTARDAARDELAVQVRAREIYLQDMQTTAPWRLLVWVRRLRLALAPPGGCRDRLARRVLHPKHKRTKVTHPLSQQGEPVHGAEEH